MFLNKSGMIKIFEEVKRESGNLITYFIISVEYTAVGC